MPNYKYSSVFHQRPNDGNFDIIHSPGQIVQFSGIYRCVNCGFEAVSTRGNWLPPEANCSQHSPRWPSAYGNPRWQLVAAAIHTKANV